MSTTTHCSYGLDDEADGTIDNDIEMTYWQGTIIGPPHSVHENRIYSVKITCGPQYPDVPPAISFIHRINLARNVVDSQSGRVNLAQLSVDKLHPWNRAYDMERCLKALRTSVITLFNHFLTFTVSTDVSQ